MRRELHALTQDTKDQFNYQNFVNDSFNDPSNNMMGLGSNSMSHSFISNHKTNKSQTN